jgi:hypothetical protein
MALLEIGLPKSIAKALRLPTNSPKRQQLRVLKTLLKKAKYTQFGQHYGFENILGQRHTTTIKSTRNGGTKHWTAHPMYAGRG